jgi:N4-(beta-N-acetylglucosaminyl)-L-asparaginase
MGAVGGIRHIKDAARAAAFVKDHTRHSILVGELAGQFAAEMGLIYSSLTTGPSAQLHRDWLNQDCQPNFRKAVTPDPSISCGPYSRVEGPVYLRQSVLEVTMATGALEGALISHLHRRKR